MKYFTHFLEGHKVVHRNVIRRAIHRDFRDIDSPGKRGVSRSAILFFIPNNVAGLFVAGQAAERTVFGDMSATNGAKFLWRRRTSKLPRSLECLSNSLG